MLVKIGALWYNTDMETWMIILIVSASILVSASLGFVIASAAFFKRTFGRRKFVFGKGGAKYGVCPEWFDAPEISAATSDLSVTSFDGLKLAAKIIRARENNGRLAIIQHGYRTDYRVMQPYAQMFYERGYDVLLPSARAHGDSEGEYIGMAWLDRFDVLRWIDKVNELYSGKANIVLFGVSMGGSAVAAACGMSPPLNVKCVIDDCGFSSVSDEYDAFFADKPVLGKILRPSLDAAMRLKLGYSIGDADITELVKNASVPALFVHGTKDGFVPYSLGRKLCSAYAADKEFLSVDGAEHARCYAFDKDAYVSAVCGFADKYCK